jgi:hypothetical protein
MAGRVMSLLAEWSYTDFEFGEILVLAAQNFGLRFLRMGTKSAICNRKLYLVTRTNKSSSDQITRTERIYQA